MKKETLFATEIDLCAAFLSALPKGWTPYAETGGWDILLSRDADGLQIGVQAKLKFNLDVVSQALEQGGGWWAGLEGPDFRAVLVPFGEGRLGPVASYIGLTALSVSRVHQWSMSARPGKPLGWEFRPALPTGNSRIEDQEWHDWMTARRHKLPDYVPDVPAGSKAPLQLTHWKIAAIKIAVTIELRGFVTREDFKHHDIDHRRWVHTNGWLDVGDRGWVPSRLFPDFKSMHPRNYVEIKADADKWLLKMPGTPVSLPRLADVNQGRRK